MSPFFKWYSEIDIIDCQSFKACYQLLSKMSKHGFHCTSNIRNGNNLCFVMSKNETSIAVYVTYTLYDGFNCEVISYFEYVSSLERKRIK